MLGIVAAAIVVANSIGAVAFASNDDRESSRHSGSGSAESRPSATANSELASNGGEAIRLGRGAWTYFTDPRSVSDDHTTFAGWITPGGWVNVSSYDWTTHKRKVAQLGPRLGKDDHNNPALVLRPDGRLTVFYSAHSGPGLRGSATRRLYTRTTVKPGNISRWTRARTVSTNVGGGLGYTYPNPIALGRSKIWLAWRGGNWFPTTSTGRRGRWTSARNLLTARGHSRTRIRGSLPQRPYAKYARAAGGRVHMAYTDGHPYEDRTSLYYVSVNPARRTIQNVAGKTLARQGTALPVRSGTRVYSWRAHGVAWVMDVADDGNGKPIIVYTAGWHPTSKIAFRIARWTGKRWVDSFLAWAADAPRRKARGYGHRFISGALTIDHNDPHRFFLSRGIGSRYRVEVWTANENYTKWERKMVSPPGLSCFRPTGSRGHDHRVVLFLCGSHRGWRRFNSSVYMAGF